GSSLGPSLKYAGADFVDGQFAAWTPIAAEQTATGYEVAWKAAGADLYGIWYTDSNGNYVSSPAGGLSGASTTLQSFETSFQQDLNHDGVIGINVPTTLIESNGVTSLTQVGSNYFLFATGRSSGPTLSYAGAPVTVGEFGANAPIGAEKTATG